MIRRVTMLAGAFAALAGLTVLAIGGVRALQPGDEVVTHPLVLSGYDDPGGVYDRPLNIVATPTPAPLPVQVVIPAAPPLRDIPYRLIIDKIGVNAPVGTYGLGADQIPDVPSNGQEVAWYDFSSQPGTGSNAVFAGHVTWSGRGVFYHLDDLTAGDQVTLVANNGGARLAYTVSDVFLVDPNDPNAASVMSPTPGKDQVTIITCGGDPFYVGGTAGYDYTHRLIVRASLTEVFAADPVPASGG
jgi:LPXTG-site transpeptidase (sortase) family protein